MLPGRSYRSHARSGRPDLTARPPAPPRAVTFNVDTTQMVWNGSTHSACGSGADQTACIPFDGVTTLRVRAMSAALPNCPTIFNSTVLANVTNATTGVTALTNKTTGILDAECDVHVAGVEVPVIINNGGTFRGPMPALPPLVLGMGSSGLPWQANPLTSQPGAPLLAGV